jgi:hypothetical protein
MADGAYSFVFDRQAAVSAFRGVEPRAVTMALLAGLAPDPAWEGCEVGLGESPLGPGTVCVRTRGPGAGELQLRLVEAFERQGVPIRQVYEGGPDEVAVLATVRGGRWG